MSRVLAGLSIFFVCMLAAAPAFAQSARADANATTPPLTELLERLEALQRRVESLERELAARGSAADAPVLTPPGAAPTTATGPHTSHLDQEQALGASAQVAAEQGLYPSLRLHGFMDVNFADIGDGTPSGFHMGQLVLHMASSLGPKVNVFAEASFAPRDHGSRGTVPTSYVTDVERALIRYDHNDAFKMSFGRFHTPIGYWNNAYHHGLYLQTTISRPEMIEFGTSFQPVHFIGVLAEGRLPGSRLGLGYSAGLGNGRASLLTRAGDAGDSNSHKAVLGNLYARPQGFRALEVGVSVYHDRLTPQTGPSLNEWITSAHVAWTNETPEIIAEVVNVRHTDRGTGATFSNPAYYVQAGYRLPWQGALWKPYFRFENISPARGSLFGDLDGSVSTLGVRYDVADFAAFKGEYRRSRQRAVDVRHNGLFVQTSFTF